MEENNHEAKCCNSKAFGVRIPQFPDSPQRKCIYRERASLPAWDKETLFLMVTTLFRRCTMIYCIHLLAYQDYTIPTIFRMLRMVRAKSHNCVTNTKNTFTFLLKDRFDAIIANQME